jgi:hypothetical protein
MKIKSIIKKSTSVKKTVVIDEKKNTTLVINHSKLTLFNYFKVSAIMCKLNYQYRKIISANLAKEIELIGD